MVRNKTNPYSILFPPRSRAMFGPFPLSRIGICLTGLLAVPLTGLNPAIAMAVPGSASSSTTTGMTEHDRAAEHTAPQPPSVPALPVDRSLASPPATCPALAYCS